MIRNILTLIVAIFILSACTNNQQTNSTDFSPETPEIISEISSWQGKTPELANASDSASFIIGYLNGNSLSDAKKYSDNSDLKNLDNDQFFKGVAMALEADSANKSLMLGIMAGMELLGATQQYSLQLPVDWNNTAILRGYYHGLNGDLRGPMPSAMIEAELNRILGNIYKQNQDKK